jgi:hypothetical protein
MLTRLASDTSFSYLLVRCVAFGIGTGRMNPAITNNAVSGMPPSQARVAAATVPAGRDCARRRDNGVGGALGPARAVAIAFC